MSPRNNLSEDDSELEEKRLTLFEHLEELRSRIIKSLVAVLIGTIIAFYYSAQLLDFLIRPCIPIIKVTYYTSIMQPFNIRFKAAIFGGIVLASPLILYHFMRFIGPAMTRKEKKVVMGLFGFAILSFFAGVSFAYFYLIPVGTEVLISYQTPLMSPLIGIDDVVSFVVFFLLGMGLVCELPLVMMGLAKVGIVSSRFLRKNWKMAIFVIFFVSFAVTPGSEIMTSLILAGPLFLLYELSIVLIKLVEKKKTKEEEEWEKELERDEEL